MTYAKIIADSVSPNGDRLTTFEVRFHRFVLAEFNTHRVFSRNSASSRAIPVAKQIQRLYDDPAFPVSWPAEQSGMQGGVELDGSIAANAEQVWSDARDEAISTAENLRGKGVHKSVTNRLLEPFMWHTAVVTATAWDNFFGQRCNPLAQPEIRAAAEEMHRVFQESVPRQVHFEEWHLPYITQEDRNQAGLEALVQVSSARCARVSYLTQDGVRDLGADRALYARLTSATPMHASPLEHVATPRSSNWQEVVVNPALESGPALRLQLPKYGNLIGWHQHRFDVEAALNYQAFA